MTETETMTMTRADAIALFRALSSAHRGACELLGRNPIGSTSAYSVPMRTLFAEIDHESETITLTLGQYEWRNVAYAISGDATLSALAIPTYCQCPTGTRVFGETAVMVKCEECGMLFADPDNVGNLPRHTRPTDSQ